MQKSRLSRENSPLQFAFQFFALTCYGWVWEVCRGRSAGILDKEWWRWSCQAGEEDLRESGCSEEGQRAGWTESSRWMHAFSECSSCKRRKFMLLKEEKRVFVLIGLWESRFQQSCEIYDRSLQLAATCNTEEASVQAKKAERQTETEGERGESWLHIEVY